MPNTRRPTAVVGVDPICTPWPASTIHYATLAVRQGRGHQQDDEQEASQSTRSAALQLLRLGAQVLNRLTRCRLGIRKVQRVLDQLVGVFLSVRSSRLHRRERIACLAPGYLGRAERKITQLLYVDDLAVRPHILVARLQNRHDRYSPRLRQLGRGTGEFLVDDDTRQVAMGCAWSSAFASSAFAPQVPASSQGRADASSVAAILWFSRCSTTVMLSRASTIFC